jgi:hypothetical protein
MMAVDMRSAVSRSWASGIPHACKHASHPASYSKAAYGTHVRFTTVTYIRSWADAEWDTGNPAYQIITHLTVSGATVSISSHCCCHLWPARPKGI